MSSLPGYDTWLARYRHDVVDAWCDNPKCVVHRDPIPVDYEEENGQGWITPEDCPHCRKGALILEEPDYDEEDDDVDD